MSHTNIYGVYEDKKKRGNTGGWAHARGGKKNVQEIVGTVRIFMYIMHMNHKNSASAKTREREKESV